MRRVVALGILLALTVPAAAGVLAPIGIGKEPVCSMSCAGTEACCCAKRVQPHRDAEQGFHARAAEPFCATDCATLPSIVPTPDFTAVATQDLAIPGRSYRCFHDRPAPGQKWELSGCLPRGPPG